MNEKSWYKSRTIWGALIALAAYVLNHFGFVVSPEEQATLVDHIMPVVVPLSALVACVLTIIGRFRAEKRIK